MMKNGSRRAVFSAARARGFTLIELLVVVATVSILGSMAVPIFLESKTRARVAKARADMRMVALGMETYFSDYGYYPRPDDENGAPLPEDSFIADPYDTRVPVVLTTPIAYMDRRYSDPFVNSGDLGNRSYLLYTKAYFQETVGEPDYWQYLADVVGPSSVLQVEYVVLSRGPDLDHDEPLGHLWPTGDNAGDPRGPALYDPTNGSISNGDIIYMGAGIGYKDR